MKLLVNKDVKISEGTCGPIFRGKLGQYLDVAVKEIALKELTVIQSEEKALLRIDHPNIVRLLCVDQTEDLRLYGYELCLASLEQCFLPKENPRKYKGPMPLNINILSCLANGLDYIHSQGIIHGDINPRSVLISSRPYVTVKWTGLLPPIEKSSSQAFQLNEIIYFASWMPPEIISWLLDLISDGFVEIDPIDVQREGSFEGDVFSAGCLFFYILTEGRHPFGQSLSEIFQNLVSANPVYFEELPYEHAVTEIIRQMLRFPPKERLSLSRVAHQIILEESKSNKKLHHFCFQKDEEIILNNLRKMIQIQNVNFCSFSCIKTLFESCKEDVLLNCPYKQCDKRLRRRLTSLDPRRNDPEHEATRIASYRQVHYYSHYNLLLFFCTYYSEDNLINFIQVLLSCGVDIESVDDFGRNSLILVCDNYFGSQILDVIVLLVECGVQVNWFDYSGRNALFYLCKHYYRAQTLETIQFLMARGLQIDLHDNNGWNALLILCRYYLSDNSTKMSLNSPIQVEDDRSFPLLSTGRYRSQFGNILQLLLRGGSDIYCADNQGVNAFLLLCQYYPHRDLAEILEFFIQNGMDVNYKDESATSALLHLSCRPLEHLGEALKLLLLHGAQINSTDVDGETVLMNFCENLEVLDIHISTEIIRLFLKYGVEVNQTDIFGRNALILLLEFTTYENATDIVDLLVKNDININLRDHEGRNALLILCKQRYKGPARKLIKYLINHGINVRQTDRQGRNSLLVLCEHYEEEDITEIARILIKSGCDVNCCDRENENSFSKILKRRDKMSVFSFIEIVSLLHESGITVTKEAMNRDVMIAIGIRHLKAKNITVGFCQRMYTT